MCSFLLWYNIICYGIGGGAASLRMCVPIALLITVATLSALLAF